MKLSHASAAPQDILQAIENHFAIVYRPRALYRTTGIALLNLHENTKVQLDLFGSALKSEGLQRVFESVDEICEKYGKHTIFLASSFGAMVHAAHQSERGDTPQRVTNLFAGENTRQRLNIPMLGDVS